jgi:hypothetical protein
MRLHTHKPVKYSDGSEKGSMANGVETKICRKCGKEI